MLIIQNKANMRIRMQNINPITKQDDSQEASHTLLLVFVEMPLHLDQANHVYLDQATKTANPSEPKMLEQRKSQ